jgi:hypothetical protein
MGAFPDELQGSVPELRSVTGIVVASPGFSVKLFIVVSICPANVDSFVSVTTPAVCGASVWASPGAGAEEWLQPVANMPKPRTTLRRIIRDLTRLTQEKHMETP